MKNEAAFCSETEALTFLNQNTKHRNLEDHNFQGYLSLYYIRACLTPSAFKYS